MGSDLAQVGSKSDKYHSKTAHGRVVFYLGPNTRLLSEIPVKIHQNRGLAMSEEITDSQIPNDRGRIDYAGSDAVEMAEIKAYWPFSKEETTLILNLPPPQFSRGDRVLYGDGSSAGTVQHSRVKTGGERFEGEYEFLIAPDDGGEYRWTSDLMALVLEETP